MRNLDNNNGTESVNSNNRETLNNETAIVEIFESLRTEYQNDRTKKIVLRLAQVL